jgi:hypothetical protein
MGKFTKVQDEAMKTIENLRDIIRTATAEKPLILFTKHDGTIENDDYYDYPIGFYVSHPDSKYYQGNVMSINGDNVKLFLNKDKWGEIHDIELDDLHFIELVYVLDYL